MDATFSLDQIEPVNGLATFTVVRPTQTKSYGQSVYWVTVDCFDIDGNKLAETDDDRVVIWGMWDSVTGHTEPVQVFGVKCVAKLTFTPWRPKKNEPTIEFLVTS